MSPNCQRLAFTFKGTDLSSTGGHTYCLSLRDANKCEYDCSLFLNNLLLERLGICVMKRTVGYMAFQRALSINLLPRAILNFFYMCLLTGRFFWYKVISIHQAIHLVRIQIDSVEVGHVKTQTMQTADCRLQTADCADRADRGDCADWVFFLPVP